MELKSNEVGKPDIKNLGFVEQLSSISTENEISRDDFSSLVISGEFSRGKYQRQLIENDSENLYCVNRSRKIEQVLSDDASILNKVFVTSDIGNGKTVFLSQLATEALNQGYNVFIVRSELDEVFAEVEMLLERTERQIFIVDDYIRHRRISKFIALRLSGNHKLIVSGRSDIEDTNYEQLTDELSGAFKEIDLNQLSTDEISQWERLLDRWGFWEDHGGADQQSRMNFLKKDCGAENRSIILAIFKKPRVADKIKSIVEYFLI